MNRRQFLAAMGLGSGSLLLPSGRSGARAEEAETPQRLLIFYTQHGTWYDGWKMGTDWHPSDQAWEMSLNGLDASEFSDALLPLLPFRDRLLLIDGLALVSAEADLSGLRHEVGQVQSLTAAPIELVSGVPMASAASLDQVIAQHIGRSDRYRSLELAVGEPPMSVVYSGNKQILPFEASALRTYERLFGLSDGHSDTSEYLRQSQTSVLDMVSARHKALASRLSEADRQKLEIHRELVRELEQRLAGLSQLSCPGGATQPTGSEDYAETALAVTQMIGSAFACDLTRVITLQMGELPVDMVVPGYAGSLHDEFAHAVWTDPYAAQVMTDYTHIHAQQFSEILAQLDSIPEGSGSLLDNTLCVWLGELGDGTHGFNKWTAVLAGGSAFQMGRYLHFPDETPLEGWTWDGSIPQMGKPHQHLLISLLQAFGIETDRFGSTEILGTDGVKIDCTGPLL